MATNYEAIRNMSKSEMAAVFYMFIKPMMDAFEASEEDKNKIIESILTFLDSEVKGKHENPK